MRRGAVAVAAVLAVFVACAAWLPGAAIAQTAQVGQVAVSVKDAIGGAVPGASVQLISQERGFSRSAVTDEEGACLLTVLPLGKYSVTVSFPGFEKTSVVDNVVESDKTTSLEFTLKLSAVADSTVVKGGAPIVDARTQTQETRFRAESFDRMPFARSFLALIVQAPGVGGTGNVNAHGALRRSNVFLIDGVDVTDPATGTFGGDVHFEAVQEVVVRSSALSAEFGRSTGAVVDVITRSGTNLYDTTYRFFATNDIWNSQTSTHSQTAPFTPLARTRFDRVNPVSSWTAGGPLSRNRIWFFVSLQDQRETSPARQTNAPAGVEPENYQQIKRSPFTTARINAQLAANHSLWVKFDRTPTTGYVMDYFGGAAERKALTSQNQSGSALSAQYTGVFGSVWTAEVIVARVSNRIDATAFESSALAGGAPVVDLSDGRAYNGSGIIGYVSRPRVQANAAVSRLTRIAGRIHDTKIGLDWQDVHSESLLQFPSGSLYLAESFNPAVRDFLPLMRQDYDTAPSRTTGRELAVYARDKFEIGRRLNVNAGVRLEHQTGHGDAGFLTLNSLALSPRVSASFALTPDGDTLAMASYGRFHDNVLLQYSDAFSAAPQQTAYNTYMWDGTQYVFTGRVEQTARTLQPNLDVTPRRMDELTFGIDRRLGFSLGASVRVIHRAWSNMIDDVRSFDADGRVVRSVGNLPEATRSYDGVEFVVDRRWAERWAASSSYTYSRTRGNHFSDDFSALGDFVNSRCQQNTDPGLGNANGIFPCSDLQAHLQGTAPYDRPHLLKFSGAYAQPIGKVDVTAGVVASAVSKTTYSKQRTVNVLLPGTEIPSGQTLVYYYEPRGVDRVPGLLTSIDLMIEAAFQPIRGTRVGLRAEAFNLFNAQSQIDVNNTAYCNETSTASCQAANAAYGTATTRGSFQSPRTVRVSVVLRFSQR